MTTLQVEVHPLAQSVEFSDCELIVHLIDGRTLYTPLEWFSSLSTASRSQLENFIIMGDGEGIHWPQLDEDLSVRGLLLGTH